MRKTEMTLRLRQEVKSQLQELSTARQLSLSETVSELIEKESAEVKKLGKQLYSELGGNVAALDDELHGSAVNVSASNSDKYIGELCN